MKKQWKLRKASNNRYSRMMAEKDRPRIIICGTRAMTDERWVFKKLDEALALLKNKHPIIISGTAPGPDTLGEQWVFHRSREKQCPMSVVRFHPDKEKHGSPACYFIRNRDMAEYASQRKPGYCIAFWDGESTGTADMIKQAKKHGLKIRIIRFSYED